MIPRKRKAPNRGLKNLQLRSITTKPYSLSHSFQPTNNNHHPFRTETQKLLKSDISGYGSEEGYLWTKKEEKRGITMDS